MIRKKTWIYIVALMILFVLPVLNSVTRNSQKQVTSGDNGSYEYSIKQRVEQTIILEGKLKKIVIPIKKIAGDNQNGVVIVSLKQGDKQLIKEYEVNKLTDEIVISSGMKKFNIGELSLCIYGRDFSDVNDLLVYGTDNITTGLPNSIVAGDAGNSPICLTYEILKYNSFFYYSIILLILVVVLVFLSSVALANRDKFIKGNFFYWNSVALIFLIVSVYNPQTSFFAEPVSEMTYEFWYKAHTMGFLENLMSLMSGECIVWPERILMFVADLITPIKYVFVVVQLLELIFISMTVAMLCLRNFEKYIPIEIRFPLTIILGVYGMYPKSYWLWTMSYWIMFFIVFAAFLDMEQMKKYKYILLLLFTIILCVSRLYNVVFIPMAILVVFIFNNRGIRFKIYCMTVALASLFSIVYSLKMGGTGHLTSGRGIDILLYIENSVYWYIQAFISLVFGEINSNQFAINMLSLGLLILLIFWMIKLYCTKDKQNIKFATIILCAGIMGGGSVLLDVVTMHLSSTVSMAYNYGKPVDWTRTFFQLKDFHFGMAYFSFVIIGCTLFYYIYIKKRDYFSNLNVNLRPFLFIGVSFILFNCYILHTENPIQITSIPVDWKNTSYITSNDAYYMSVNNDFGVAQISLTQNSKSKIIGRDDSKKMYEWTYGMREYTHLQPYNSVDLTEINSMKTDKIMSLTVKKALTNFSVVYYANFFDENDNLIVSVKQANSSDRKFADFYLDEMISGVSKITFSTEEGYPLYIMDALQFGIYDINASLSDDFHLSIDYCNGTPTQEGSSFDVSNNEDDILLEGWAEKISCEECVDKIDVCCGDTILNAKLGIENEYVAKYYNNNNLLNCGWSVSIPIDLIKKDDDGVIELITYKGKEKRVFFYYFDRGN